MAERYITDSKTQALVQGGLTPHQAALYESLARRGVQTATRACFFAGVPRTLGYKVLAELQGLGLVIKQDTPGKVAKFVAAHPLKLKELADKRVSDANDAKLALTSTLATLISDFNTVTGSPGVRMLEGVEGYKELLEDQLIEKKPITTFKSPKYVDFKEVSDLYDKYCAKITDLNVPIKEQTSPALPADVSLYGDKTAITIYQEPLMTMIIENVAINKTFRVLLNL